MRQPTTTWEEFLRVFLSLCSRSSHLESGTLFLRVLASGSHCSGCLVSGVAFVYESWILWEMTFPRGCNAWYTSGYMFCVSTPVALEEFTHFLRCGRLEI